MQRLDLFLRVGHHRMLQCLISKLTSRYGVIEPTDPHLLGSI